MTARRGASAEAPNAISIKRAYNVDIVVYLNHPVTGEPESGLFFRTRLIVDSPQSMAHRQAVPAGWTTPRRRSRRRSNGEREMIGSEKTSLVTTPCGVRTSRTLCRLQIWSLHLEISHYI